MGKNISSAKSFEGYSRDKKGRFLKGSIPKVPFKKGYPSWIKGKHHTQESIEKNIQAHIGKKLSEKTREKVSKSLKEYNKSHPNIRKEWGEKRRGYKHSEETKRKIGLGNKGKKVSLILRLKQSKTNKRLNIRPPSRKGIKLSENHKMKLSKLKKGKNNSFYKKHHTKESIQKIKEARAKQILPVKDTTIEVKIQNFLKQLGIEFFTHQYIKINHGYQCDILIPSMNLVIECDGDYWHKYPIGNDLDNIRTKELIQKGFKVLRLWECEIKKMCFNNFNNILNNCKEVV